MTLIRLSCVLSLLITWSAVPTAIRADSIQYSNPYYSAANDILYSPIGDPYAYYAIDDSDSNATGDLVFSSDTGYATAYGAADTFHLRASSSVDASQMAAHGWDNLVSDGSARFETDFVITSDQPQVSVDLAYAFTTDFVGGGTYGGQFQLLLLEWVPNPNRPGRYRWDNAPPDDTTDAGEYVLVSYSLTPGALYQLRMAANAVSGNAGYSTASTRLDASLSLHTVPEPTSAPLVIAGLLVLAGWRRARD